VRIDDDHMYHGAALIQIAEHPQFTAINSLKLGGNVVQLAYKVNDEIAVYLKYAGKSVPKFGEYPFTFLDSHLTELSNIAEANPKTFVALVCVRDREVCCLTYAQLQQLITRRKTAKGEPEKQYVVLVTVPKGKSMRVYVNAPGVKKKTLGKSLLINRNAFPGSLFG